MLECAGSLRFSRRSGASLRQAFRGRWLYIHGDSSARGLVLSLYQQLVLAPGSTFDLQTWLGGTDVKYLRWVDAIVDARTGALTGVHAPGKSCHALACTLPEKHRTSLGQQLWQPRMRNDRIRVTWRFASRAKIMADDPFFELSSSPAPDYHILQVGAWDDDPRLGGAYPRHLLRGLHRWREAAALARPQPRLAFVTSPAPARYLPGGATDACGAWHAARWGEGARLDEAAAWANVTAGVPLLNRVSSAVALAAALGSRCKCLAPDAREPMRQSMRYHPPHLHNLVDTQRLMDLLLRDGDAAQTSVSAPSSRLQLAQDLHAGCCCEPPPEGNRTTPEYDAETPIRMWGAPCLVAE
jgi:hypothetical protein